MLNQCVLVGRLNDKVEIEQVGEHKRCEIVLAIPRSYKNSDGEYETDFVKIILWDAIATSFMEYCNKGDLIGIKGRVEVDENGQKIVAEKITFLSSKKGEDNE